MAKNSTGQEIVDQSRHIVRSSTSTFLPFGMAHFNLLPLWISLVISTASLVGIVVREFLQRMEKINKHPLEKDLPDKVELAISRIWGFDMIFYSVGAGVGIVGGILLVVLA